MPRRTRTIDDRMVDAALASWLEWLMAELVELRSPMRSPSNNQPPEVAEKVWEVFASRIRSNVDHSDPVLSRLCEQEYMPDFWPKGIHGIIMAMPELWRLVLLCKACGLNQSQTAEMLELSQQHVSALLSLVRSRFVPSLRMLAGTAMRVKGMVERPQGKWDLRTRKKGHRIGTVKKCH